ncbi:response regulator transcription factor [Rhodocytophaga aerolata]|uniref:Response regulator transcription factor n=1 Tax=Rhodocytophaga aerolata TaxID=455078 RepID=A0ABT8RIZ4_9BACT|nr:response regulator transcription factor [Rhodocytophaga aerolata]MDO1450805.1 response regulator transcription factor [Rhodocytophaga aerolata]
MIKLLLYEDNKPLREGLSMLMGGSEGFMVAGAFPNCNNVVEEVALLKPDVVLMDINMPGVGGLAGLKLIKNQFPEVKVVMLTVFDDNQTVFDAMKAGADGYLLKKTPPAKLLEYLQDVYQGGAAMTASVARQVLQLFAHAPVIEQKKDYQLSDREKEVLQWLVNGYSYKMIAGQLFISLETVRSHIKKIYEKLHVHSKTEAVTKAYKDKLF